MIRIRHLLSRNVRRTLETKLSKLSIRAVADTAFGSVRHVCRQLTDWTRPIRSAGTTVIGSLGDLRRTKTELVAENALLRHQLAILNRKVRRPKITAQDRLLTVLLARLLPGWRDALHMVKPATVLGWHRRLFKIYWRRKSRPRPPRMVRGTAALIRRIALENRTWGAERIRGEMLKLGVKFSKRTVQRITWKVRRDADPGVGQSWRNFVTNHQRQLWACDFVQVHDLLFRSVFAFFIVDVPTRRVVHAGVTRCPTDRWVAQQLREATAWDKAPKYLLLDNDAKFGVEFDTLAVSTGIELVHTAVHEPVMNSVCERFIGSVRRECLDHVVILSEAGMRRLVEEYVRYFNESRPHQGLGQQIPAAVAQASSPTPPKLTLVSSHSDSAQRVDRGVVSVPVLGGLHHDYHRLAA